MKNSVSRYAVKHHVLLAVLPLILAAGTSWAIDIQATQMNFYPVGAVPPNSQVDNTLGALNPGSGTPGFTNAIIGGLFGDTGVISTGAGNTASGGFSSDIGPTYGDMADGFFNVHWYASAVWSSTTAGPNTWSHPGPGNAADDNTPIAPFSYSFNLAPGDVAFGLFFNWNNNNDIPVLAVFRETSPGVWTPVDTGDGADVDSNGTFDGDGTPGTDMQTTPFPGQTPAFSGVTAQIDPPDAFSFTDQSNVATSAVIVSNSVTITGLSAPAAISVTGGQYEINGNGSWTSNAGTINNNDQVRVRHTSAATNNTLTNTILTINGAQDTFTSTTLVIGPDPVPDPFSFPTQSAVSVNTVVTSAATTITGLTAPADISISAGSDYEINGSGVWTNVLQMGAIVNNTSVRVRHTSAANFATSVVTTLTIGGVQGTFTSTTQAADTTPTAFLFPSKTNEPLSSTVVSDPIVVAGINAATPVSVSNGDYEVNGSGTWVSVAGTVVLGDQVRVRHTSASTAGTETTTTLTIGGVSGTFKSTTVAAARPLASNFTMLDVAGQVVGGTNDVAFTWDGTFNTNPATAVVNATIASNYPFFGFRWQAYDVKIYGPGTYTIPTTGGNECPFAGLECAVQYGSGSYTVTVNQGQVMGHMKFTWSTSQGIDVIIVWNRNEMFGPSAMYTGPASGNVASAIWDFASTDADSDGVNGLAMIDGPFRGFRANFNLILNGAGGGNTTYETVPMDAPSPAKQPGCSISPTPVHPMERGDWWLIAGFIAWLAVWRRRVRQQSLR